MARIKGVDIPNDKHICISLTYIYGIGRSLAKKICKKVFAIFLSYDTIKMSR